MEYFIKPIPSAQKKLVSVLGYALFCDWVPLIRTRKQIALQIAIYRLFPTPFPQKRKWDKELIEKSQEKLLTACLPKSCFPSILLLANYLTKQQAKRSVFA